MIEKFEDYDSPLMELYNSKQESRMDRAIKNITKIKAKVKNALANEIWSSVLSYLRAYKNITDQKEFKVLQTKHKDRQAEYAQQYNKFDADMKDKGKGFLKRVFNKESKEIALALNNHGSMLTFWK